MLWEVTARVMQQQKSNVVLLASSVSSPFPSTERDRWNATTTPWPPPASMPLVSGRTCPSIVLSGSELDSTSETCQPPRVLQASYGTTGLVPGGGAGKK
jgi:hypothetical protein